MANRLFKQFLYSLEKQPVALFGKFTFTSGTAFTSDVGGLTLTRNNTGAFTITLADKYTALLNCIITVESATNKDIVPLIKSEDVDGVKTITFVTLTGTTATDLAATDKLYITVLLRNSTK